jgi:AhpC/TSA antioxidant enzyme
MSTAEDADSWFETYGVAGFVRLSDPDKTLYRQFGLEEGSLYQLAHPRVWLPWFRTAITTGHGVGAAGPNWRQLGGAFVIRSGQILAESRHENSSIRPDYLGLIAHARSGTAIRG